MKKYVTHTNARCHLNWNFFQKKLDNLNLEECANELMNLFENQVISEERVKTFHISTNMSSDRAYEPTHKNTIAMIYKFLTFIYQRNIIASLSKFILLKNILQKFSTSLLTTTYKGIFRSMQTRLKEVIFECVLTAFNGSNYDNYLIINHLVIILTNLNENIMIFKKGPALSTIKIVVKSNLTQFNNISNTRKKRTKKETGDKWFMKLFIKDIRNMVSSRMSLDKVGKLFNLDVTKLCFPYNKATSIKVLKSLTNLRPNDDLFWRDTFTSKKPVPLEDRLEAQALFTSKGFQNLYEYSDYYLKQDCLLLHSIVLILFRNYLADGINIFLRRNYSQSNLAYQQLFIVEPSRQIEQVLAPKKISNTFVNYFIKQAVTGGLCTSFVQGEINNNTIINEHLNYVENCNWPSNAKIWPNFSNINRAEKSFKHTPSGILTVDIRSLYPSAALKQMPVNSPLLYTRSTQNDFHQLLKQNKESTVNVQSFCENVRKQGTFNSDKFKLINEPPRFYNEFHALNHYMATLPKNIIVIRFQSHFTALGQLFFGDYPIDGFLAFKQPGEDKIFLKLIQYQSVYRHGHINTCQVKNDENQQKLADTTSEIRVKITSLLQHFVIHFLDCRHPIDYEYVEISDCGYNNHKITKYQDKDFLFSFKKVYTYQQFLGDILKKKLTGLIVVKNLEIKKNNQNPLFGFIVQRAQYNVKHLSEHTRQQLSNFCEFPKVISLHKSSEFMVISTDYFVKLHELFGFENTPDIYHALLFQQAPYLRQHIEAKLETRRDLKNKIKKESHPGTKLVYEIKAELIKLMLNSCYGFTLCNLTSSKFRMLKNLQTLPKTKKRKQKLKSCVELSCRVFLAECKRTEVRNPFETILGHVGCSILFHSKIILLKRLYFLLKFLNPTKAQLLYMDTDSAHFMVKHENFADNVDENLKNEFNCLYNKHFETGEKISGIWVIEGYFKTGQYIGEKCYILTGDDNHTLTHMKGLNNMFQAKFVTENNNLKEKPYVSYNIMYKSPDFAIYKTYMSKNIFANYIPIKRYFISAAGSLPLNIN